MKIAYLNSFYAPNEVGGAEKSVRFLAESVVANGHEATVITLGSTRETAELNGVRIERLPIQNLYFPIDAGTKSGLQKMLWHAIDSYNPGSRNGLSAILNKIQPDVVHTNNLSGFSVSAWSVIAARKTPIVHTLRDYYLICPNTAMFKNGSPCVKRCTQCDILSIPKIHTSQKIGHVVGNSQFILKKHTNLGLFNNAKKSVVYNAYAPRIIENNRPINETVFGFIGRITPTKGVNILIKAAEILFNKTQKKFKVLIAGEGDKNFIANLKSETQGLPITWVGHQEPEKFYNQIHWTVLPSIWDEPLARVLFESFSHGVPVIGSATGGTPELLEHGKTGLIYKNPLDASELADRLASALQEPNYDFISNTCIKQGSQFRPLSVYEQYMNIYQSAIRSHTEQNT